MEYHLVTVFSVTQRFLICISRHDPPIAPVLLGLCLRLRDGCKKGLSQDASAVQLRRRGFFSRFSMETISMSEKANIRLDKVQAFYDHQGCGTL